MNKLPQQVNVEIPRMAIKEFQITLIGDSPLVMHKWSEKAKRMMLDKQMKKAQKAREAKDPKQDYLDTIYWTENHKPGFPSIGFKSAAVDACSHVSDLTKVISRGAFHVDGELVEIKGKYRMRQDVCRIGMGTADVRFRAEFPEWETTFKIRYNSSVLSMEQIVNLFNVAGFAIGVGEHRPQKDGSWGMFHVKQS